MKQKIPNKLSTISINSQLLDDFKSICDETGNKVGKTVELILQQYINLYKSNLKLVKK